MTLKQGKEKKQTWERRTREQEAKHRTISMRNNSHMEKVTKMMNSAFNMFKKETTSDPVWGWPDPSRGDKKKKLPPQLELEHLVFHLHLGMRQLLSFKLRILLLDLCRTRSHLWLSHNQESPRYNMLLLARPCNQIPEQLTWKFTIKQLLKFYLRL